MNNTALSGSPGLSDRALAIIIGVLFILATALGVTNLGLLGADFADPGLLNRIDENARTIRLASVLNTAMAVAVVAIAVAFYPIIKRHHVILAHGYLAARLAEGVVLGISGALWIVLVQTSAEPSVDLQGSAIILKVSMVFFNLGAQIIFGITALILNYVLIKTYLVPRFISLWGMAGGALILSLGIVQMLGGSIANIEVAMTAPIALNEMVLAIWLIVKGFSVSDAG